jgi:YHS domain-containing protein
MGMAKDPICGMMVDTERAKFKGVYDGVPVYFCAEGCKKAYEARTKKS